jgi:Zn-dependent protease
MKLVIPSWVGRVFLVTRTRSGVPIFVHWSVPALCLFFLGTGVGRILTAVAAIAAYLTMLLLHEVGHQVVAQRLGYHVKAIRIYPVHGTCQFDAPYSRLHDALVAWGGPLAQLIVAVPLVVFVKLRGLTRIEPVDAVLAILGFFSLLVAIFNLIPLARLDGRKAWSLVPIAWERMRHRRRYRDVTPMEAMEEALRKAGKRRSG